MLRELEGWQSPLESRLLPAAIIVRPHHLLMSNVHNALCGRYEISELVRQQTEGAREATANEDYIRDVFGEPEDLQGYAERLEVFLSSLRQLPDESSILVGMGLDGICRAASVGKHCTEYGGERDRDILALGQIRQFLLVDRGYRRGKDWDDLRPVVHMMHDYEGTRYGASAPPRRVFRSLPAIVAKAGALRGTI